MPSNNHTKEEEKWRRKKMKQCKICGSPLGKEPTTEELETETGLEIRKNHL